MTAPLPFAPGEPFDTTSARRVGLSDRYIASAVSDGRLTRLRRGWYHVPAETDGPSARHLRAARAALPHGPEGAVISHHTAAVVHGIPLVGTTADRTHLTVNRPSGGRTSRHTTLHTSPLGTWDATEVDGLPVTGAARTVADLARIAGFDSGVCAADHVLHTGLVSPGELRAEADRHRGRTGAAVIRRVAAFADGRSESPGESLSRCVMARFPELPVPRLQHEFFSPGGGFVARTDFDWDGRLVGEFDGKTKYTGRGLRGQDPGEVAWAEKRREDSLRALGLEVTRWTWADLRTPDRFRHLLRSGLLRAGLR